MRSESINELAAALAKAQGQMQGARKDSMNPAFRTSYADLASVWDACRSQLSENGLSVVQCIEEPYVLVTWLLHSSGQFITSSAPIKALPRLTKEGKELPIGPQEIGSAITYMRRYSLAAIVGISPEDDDGEAAQGRCGIDSVNDNGQRNKDEIAFRDKILYEISLVKTKEYLLTLYNNHEKVIEKLSGAIRGDILSAFTRKKKELPKEPQEEGNK